MPNIYLKSKKLKPSQIENLKRNVSFIIAEMGIQIKSFSKDAPLKTKLNITVNGPFSYRTADKFLHYHSGMEISLKSCTALIQFYNTYFEPEIHGDIVAFVSHDLAKENARLKTQFHPKETDAFSRKCIDFFTGTYYIYYQSSVFAEKITGGIVQIYEWNNRLRMKLISRLMSDEELDLAKEVIEETQCTPDEGMEHFLQHERIRETGEVFFYHDEWIDINEKKTEGEALDIAHGIPDMGISSVYAGGYSDCKDCDLIIITAGRNRRPGETRLDLIAGNSQIMKDVVDQVKKYYTKGAIMIVSNPVDVLVYQCSRWMELPNGLVFGTGCVLDSSRLTRLLCVACLRISATSVISTITVDCPAAKSSDAPTRVKIASTTPICACAAGTKLPICAISAIRAFCRI